MKAVKAELWQVWVKNGRGEWVLHFTSRNQERAERKWAELRAGWLIAELRDPINEVVRTSESYERC